MVPVVLSRLATQEYFRFARAGLDGFITDFADNAIAALDSFGSHTEGIAIAFDLCSSLQQTVARTLPESLQLLLHS